ncbi:MAG: chlorite dismutase family protein [Chlamydiae bacterium]|nr:chlorite dismutase family protein [Chlamydiota bacterium]MBI3267109.1 chlorite dismutase family protein [Chlamydiota bacterium]
MSIQAAQRPPVEIPDIREQGAPKEGTPQVLDRRLFMQLQVFTGCPHPQPLVEAVKKSGLECVLYLDINDAQGIGLLTLTEDPSVLTQTARQLLLSEPFVRLTPMREFTMLGRTYSSGHEQNLEDWLLAKSRRNLSNPTLSWAVWYPLKRKPEFELLSKDEQRAILMEHAKLGMSYGTGGLAHDVRLACHGLDPNNNEFVIGIVSSKLHSISRLVEDMRKTQQTAKYIESMGPFFVGQVLFSSVK